MKTLNDLEYRIIKLEKAILKYIDSNTDNVSDYLFYEGKQGQEILNDFLGDEYYNKYNSIKNKITDNDYKDIYKLIKKYPDEVKDYIDNFKSNRDYVKAAKSDAKNYMKIQTGSYIE